MPHLHARRLAVLACAFTAALGATAQPADLYARMVAHVDAAEADLIALRHDLHRHPEISGDEERTARVVADRLRALGYTVRTDVGGHGVVARLDGGRPGPLVAFRADMDAVPSTAPDPVPYRSVVPGVRHICGHDVHTAVGVGVAEGFAAVRDDLAGSVLLVFQPAEERGDGAKAMIADDVFAAAPPDAIFALHAAPFPVGFLATAPGGMMAGRARVSVALDGAGDIDAARAAVRAALKSVGTVPPQNSGQMMAPDFVLVQLVGSQAEDRVVQGQIMTAGPIRRAAAEAAVRAALADLDVPDVTLSLTYDAAFMEGVTNDSALVDQANARIQALAPGVAVGPVPGVVPAFSEDFGSFQALVPGVMYFLGVNNPEAGTVGMPHSPNFVADDGAIRVGTLGMLAAMLGRMAGD